MACAAGLAIAVVQLLWSPVRLAWGSSSLSAWGAWLGLGKLVRLLPTLNDLAPLTTTGMLVFLAATACLLLAPLALYLALSDE